MGIGEWCLLLIVAICVFVLFRITKRRKELEARSYEKECEIEKKHEIMDEKKEPEPVAPVAHTIFASSRNRTVLICPFCDGENEADAATCVICGEDLS